MMWRSAFVLIGLATLSAGAARYWNLQVPETGTIESFWEKTTSLWERTTAAFTRAKHDELSLPETPVRVTVVEVKTEEVPIYLTAIGTAQAYQTVNVKTRVDGEITKVLFEEGQDVQAGDALVIIDPRPYEAQLRQWEATLQKNKALLTSALLDLNRYEKLIQNNTVSQQQLDQQSAVVAQARAQVASDEAQVDQANVQLDYTTLRAPISGRTGIRQVDRGNIVRAGDNTTIVVLTQLQPISVVFSAPSQQVAQSGLRIGKVSALAIALAADNATELDRGNLELIDNIVDQTTGTIRLKAQFPNAALKLWPGDFVSGRIIVEVRKDGLTVPMAAVRHGPAGDYVWVLRDDDTVEPRGISVEQSVNNRALISRGIRRGQRVVTDGHFLLKRGSRVEAARSGATASRGQPQSAADAR